MASDIGHVKQVSATVYDPCVVITSINHHHLGLWVITFPFIEHRVNFSIHFGLYLNFDAFRLWRPSQVAKLRDFHLHLVDFPVNILMIVLVVEQNLKILG